MTKYEQYVGDVLSKKIIVCDAVIKAVKRFQDDLNNKNFIFNKEKVSKIINFIETLKFSEQEFLNVPFVLENWQAFIIANLFGFETKKGNRRFKKAFVFVARGNGKSPLAAAIALTNLLLENGSQVYSISTNYSQSAIIFNYMKNFIQKDTTLSKIFSVYAHSIENKAKSGLYRPLSKSFKGFDGFNPSFVIADEVAAMQDYSLLNMFTTALHKRTNSFLFMITTANFISESSPGYMEYKYSKEILDGQIKDDNYFALIYELDVHDNINNEDYYKKANPAGFLNFELLSAMKKEALNKKELYNSFLAKNLNKWVIGAQNEFISIEKITACKNNYEKYKDKINLEVLKKSFISIGADFSDRRDLTSITFAFYLDEIKKIYLKHLIFTSNLLKWQRGESITNLFNNFRINGDIIMCEGSTIDKDIVIIKYLGVLKEFEISPSTAFYYDEWGSFDYLEILKKTANPVAVKQTLVGISEFTKNYQDFLEAEVIIDGNSCALWHLKNARVYENGVLMKLQKENKNSEKKIDSCISSLLALIGIKQHLIQENNKKFIIENKKQKDIDGLLDDLKNLYK